MYWVPMSVFGVGVGSDHRITSWYWQGAEKPQGTWLPLPGMVGARAKETLPALGIRGWWYLGAEYYGGDGHGKWDREEAILRESKPSAFYQRLLPAFYQCSSFLTSTPVPDQQTFRNLGLRLLLLNIRSACKKFSLICDLITDDGSLIAMI